jgi:quercetin dioxygenase-like cupin family protein
MTLNPNPYLLKADEVETDVISGAVHKGGSRSAKVVYSPVASVMVTTRQPGYHSRASAHEGDELDYCLSGEMWLFIEQEGFKISAGDFVRIPGGAQHWAIVRADQGPCTMIHVHTPPYVGNPGAKNTARSILFKGEEPGSFPVAKDIFDREFPMEEIERRVFEQHGLPV